MPCLLRLAALAISVLASCGGPSEPALSGPKSPPSVRIASPGSEDEFRPRSDLSISGSVDVGSGQWSPGVIVMKIVDAEAGKRNFGARGINVPPSSGNGKIPFETKLKAPREPGKYAVRIDLTAQVDGKTVQHSEKIFIYVK